MVGLLAELELELVLVLVLELRMPPEAWGPPSISTGAVSPPCLADNGSPVRPPAESVASSEALQHAPS